MLRSLVLAALIVACGQRHDDTGRADSRLTWGSNAPGLAMVLCGDVLRFIAPTPRDPGELALAGGTWGVAAGAPVEGIELLVPARSVCVHAKIDLSRRISELRAEPEPDDPWDAGS